jgi:hypothetical protein
MHSLGGIKSKRTSVYWGVSTLLLSSFQAMHTLGGIKSKRTSMYWGVSTLLLSSFQAIEASDVKTLCAIKLSA